jgi:predicted glycosyltransferase involved in capsule biosynthesis
MKIKINLKNSTFIIPIRIESADRMRNVITVVSYLLENFDTKVIVKEVDTEPVFKNEVLPQITEFLEDSIDNLTYIFEHSDDSVFYRMKIINEMIHTSSTEVVVNYDCDVLLKPETCVQAVNMIENGYDIVYPYGFGDYQKQVFVNDDTVSDFLSNDSDFSILDAKSKIYDAQYGHVQFMKRSSYIDAGMENENFRGSSPEDKERFHRFTLLGYNVGRIDDQVYHLEHSRGANSWPNSVQGNPYMKENFEEWGKIQLMNKDELKEYYSTQEYLRKYN